MVDNYTCLSILESIHFANMSPTTCSVTSTPPLLPTSKGRAETLRYSAVRTRNGHVNLASSQAPPSLRCWTQGRDLMLTYLINTQNWFHKDRARLLYSTSNRLTAGERCLAIFPRQMLTFVLMLGCSSSWHLAKCLSSWLLRTELLSLGARRTIDWSDRETQWIMSIIFCLQASLPWGVPQNNWRLMRFMVI